MSAPVAAGPVRPPDGVRLHRLRSGRTGENLFLVPGLAGEPAELDDLVAAFTGPQTVYAVAPLAADAEQRPLDSMDRVAELIVQAIRQIQPTGPYRLGGYSFGGLAALEAAQQLSAAGAEVETLFLIDALFDERYWPRGTWLRALVRRTGWQLVRIVRLPPLQAAGEIRRRGGRLLQRVRRRRTDAPDPLRPAEAAVADTTANALAAISGYRPRFYDGAITLIASSSDRHFGCDTAQLWTGYADRLDVQRIAGDHLTVMQQPASAAAIAGVIDHRLALSRPDWAGLRPVPGFARPMIVTTMRWFSAARLGHALVESGFSVSACRPAAHPLNVVDGLAGDHRLRRLRRLASLETAIRQSRPDVVLPDDERAWALLRRLHARTTDPETAKLIAHSLGHADAWPLIASRAAMVHEAQAAGVAVPETEVIGTAEAMNAWAARQGEPIVLKTDGSWGGRGVAVVRTAAHLPYAWRALSRPPTFPRAIKRAVVNREVDGLVARILRTRPVVNAQQFVEGREAIVTAASLAGEVRALVSLEVDRASEARGPAAVVRVIDHPDMADAARRVVERFGLSGFCGLDFIIGPTGEARLLELNPRVTPTCHLLVEGEQYRGHSIALFPPGTAVADVVDVPARAGALIRLGDEITARQRRALRRMGRRLTERLTVPRY